MFRRDICDSPGKKSQEPLTFPACCRRDSLYAHPFGLNLQPAFIICSIYAPSIGKLLNDKMDKSIKRYFKDPYMFYKVVPIKNVEFGPTYHRILDGKP